MTKRIKTQSKRPRKPVASPTSVPTENREEWVRQFNLRLSAGLGEKIKKFEEEAANAKTPKERSDALDGANTFQRMRGNIEKILAGEDDLDQILDSDQREPPPPRLQ